MSGNTNRIVRTCAWYVSGGPDTMGLMWDRLVEMQNKRVIGEGLKLMDGARVLLAETAPRACCVRFDRAVDGVVRCVACGRPKQI